MQTILELLNTQMNRPVMYGSFAESWFQYLSLFLFLLTMVILTIRYRHADERKLQLFLRTMAIIMIVFELYKQINFTYVNNWHYQWYAFPFQFCSTPMYIALIASFLKKGEVRNAMYMFLATFGFFAGAAVMFYPSTVYTSTVGINIQTMVHHGGMAVMGMVLLANHVPLDIKSFLKGTYVFVMLTLFAIILNGMHNLWIQDGSFNMFFINPLYHSEIPVLNLFQPLVPTIIYILIFIFGFSLVAYIMLLGRKVFAKQPVHELTYESV